MTAISAIGFFPTLVQSDNKSVSHKRPIFTASAASSKRPIFTAPASLTAKTSIQVHEGDCLTIMQSMADNSVDSIVTDPPYGIEFMGKLWDGVVPPVTIWIEALRVLKPGGHLLSFGGTRTYHRMVCAIEDAGFDIRDQIGWLYGQGFPKSHNVSKSIDAHYGAVREVIGIRKHPTLVDTNKLEEQANAAHGSNLWMREWSMTSPATPEAQQWDGWGTALKPAWEPIVLARKPFIGSVAANVLTHGTGAMNIDACRVLYNETNRPIPQLANNKREVNSKKTMFDGSSLNKSRTKAVIGGDLIGRWPANVIHDGSDEVLSSFAVSGTRGANGGNGAFRQHTWMDEGVVAHQSIERDKGSAARFFYCAKASKADRCGSKHPTVKPVSLMRYLCKLITPPNGTVLDPFAGTGTTGQAALFEGFKAILIEQDPESCNDIRHRIRLHLNMDTWSHG